MKRAFWVALVLLSGASAGAAVGDLIYRTSVAPVQVTAAQAATAADWFIARGAWDGLRSDIHACRVWRSNGTFLAACQGDKTIAPGSVPASGADFKVVGRVE